MTTVQITVTAQSDRILKIHWGGWLSYDISRIAVDGCAREIRRLLKELVDAALEDRLASSAHTLQKLAEHGNLLYQAIFTKVGGEGDPDRIRAHYEKDAGRSQFQFIVSNSIFVPWGLVYPSKPSDLPDKWPNDPRQIDWEAYRDFWCFSRQVATTYDRIEVDAVGDSSGLEMTCVVHPDTFAKAAAPLAEFPESAFLDWLKNHKPLTSPRALMDRWQNKGADVGLLYFYCHASAASLALDQNETLNAYQLFLILARGPKRPIGKSSCLVLINGCSTAVGSAFGDFLMPTSNQHVCGFIGTETDIPDVFALRFSLSLLHLLFHKGLSLREAMQLLYQNHFPLSLVYGFYAHPDFRMPQPGAPDIEPRKPEPGAPEIKPRKPENYSFGKIGTNRLEARHDA